MALPNFTIPPLPLGWTEHHGPNNQPYYHNVHTGESTYIRPLPTITAALIEKKLEKPLIKTPIPGTDWLKVTTTEGNVFYSHKIRKESVWVVPEELKLALAAFQAQESVQTGSNGEKDEGKTIHGKRKAQDTDPLNEVVTTKKTRVEEAHIEEDLDSDDDEEQEEDWQREAAEQLAAEAEEEQRKLKAEKMEGDLEAQQAQETAGNMIPQRVDLSVEEGKALFKNLLMEKDINPLHPWDISLPKFISDPRYALLSSVAARREAFDEYCKERSRELRQMQVKKERAAVNPKDEYERLLGEEVKSTRASWTDFRKAWKRDRRFYGWGRDDREREKRFREYLKELGEQKRAAAQKAESDFFVLLKEKTSIRDGLSWKEVKNNIYKDARYGAVASSSLREELFNVFLKGNNSCAAASPNVIKSEPNAMGRQERREKAVKEREEQIRVERQKLDIDIGKSKMGINKEESERSFRTLLTDAIRDPQVTWEGVLPRLKTDPRFITSSLPPNRQLHLFHSHVAQLRAKYLNNLCNVFNDHAPSLATPFSSLPLEIILSSLPVNKLGYDVGQVEAEFEKWQRERTSTSRLAFDEMLAENAFVEFWGRLGKLGGEGVNGELKIDGDDIGEGEGDDKVDMKALAKSVDIREMEEVLKNDKRYIMFEHIPAQREQWLRDYLSNLSAPKLSVHVPG